MESWEQWDMLNKAAQVTIYPLDNTDHKFYDNILQLYEKNDTIVINRRIKVSQRDMRPAFNCMVTKFNLYGVINGHTEYANSVVVKLLSPYHNDHKYRATLAHENEIEVYRRIFPFLNEFARELLPIPDCLYCNSRFIVLKDFSFEGYEMIGLDVKGLTLKQCELVLKFLAKFHAASFISRDKYPQYTEMTKLTKEILYHQRESDLLDQQSKYLDKMIVMFHGMPTTSEVIKTIAVLKDVKEVYKKAIRDLLYNDISKQHSVFCHGDLVNTNILIRNTEVRFVDFQQMRYNSLASDLVYLLYVNLHPEHYSHMKSLLKIYLDTLKEILKDKGLDFDLVLTNEWLHEEMKRWSIYGLVYGLWVSATFYIENLELIKSVEKLNNYKCKDLGPLCDERCKQMILYYMSLNNLL